MDRKHKLSLAQAVRPQPTSVDLPDHEKNGQVNASLSSGGTVIVPQFQSPTFPSQCSSPKNNNGKTAAGALQGHRQTGKKHVPVTVLEVSDDYGICSTTIKKPKNRAFERTINYLKETCCGASSCCQNRPESGYSLDVSLVESIRNAHHPQSPKKKTKADNNLRTQPNFESVVVVVDHSPTILIQNRDEICLAPSSIKQPKKKKKFNDFDEGNGSNTPYGSLVLKDNPNSAMPSLPSRSLINSPLKYTSVQKRSMENSRLLSQPKRTEEREQEAPLLLLNEYDH